MANDPHRGRSPKIISKRHLSQEKSGGEDYRETIVVARSVVRHQKGRESQLRL